MVLVQANGRVGQMGALADVLEVEPRYERAVEACLGDLLAARARPTPRACRCRPGAGARRRMRAAAASSSSSEAIGIRGGVRRGRGAVWRPADEFGTALPDRCAGHASRRAGRGRAVVDRARDERIRAGAARGHGRGDHRRLVRRGARRWRRRCPCRWRRSTATCCAATHAGVRRRQGRVARHPRHQARNQGAARAGGGRAQRARTAWRRKRRSSS